MITMALPMFFTFHTSAMPPPGHIKWHRDIIDWLEARNINYNYEVDAEPILNIKFTSSDDALLFKLIWC
jgi:hypothetical protein